MSFYLNWIKTIQRSYYRITVYAMGNAFLLRTLVQPTHIPRSTMQLLFNRDYCIQS